MGLLETIIGGVSSAETKVEVSEDAPLNVGDVVEFQWKAIGSLEWPYLRALQYEVIQSQMQKKFPNLRFIQQTYDDDYVIMRFEVMPTDPNAETLPQYEAGTMTAALVTAAVIGGGLLVLMSLDKVYKITKTPAGQVSLIGAGLGGVGIFLIVLLVAFGMLKGR